MGTSDRLGFGCGLAMGTILGQGSTVTRLSGTCRGSSSEPRVSRGGWAGGEKGREGDVTSPDRTQGLRGGRKLSPDIGARRGRGGAGIHRLVSAFGDQLSDIVRRHHNHIGEGAGKDQLPPHTRSSPDDRCAVEGGWAREGHATIASFGKPKGSKNSTINLVEAMFPGGGIAMGTGRRGSLYPHVIPPFSGR